MSRYTLEANGKRLMELVAGAKAFEPLLHYYSADGTFVDYLRRREFAAFGYNPKAQPRKWVFTTVPAHRFNAVVAVDLFEEPTASADVQQIAGLLIPNGVLMLEQRFGDDAATITETLESAGFSYIQSASERTHYFYKKP
jgi:hypothetical protein